MWHCLQIACRVDFDQPPEQPPASVLDLLPVGQDTRLRLIDLPDQVRSEIRVPARSLSLVLDAAIADSAPTGIEATQLVCREPDTGELTAPASRVLDVAVIAGDAHLQVIAYDGLGWRQHPPVDTAIVDAACFAAGARTCLHALPGRS